MRVAVLSFFVVAALFIGMQTGESLAATPRAVLHRISKQKVAPMAGSGDVVRYEVGLTGLRGFRFARAKVQYDPARLEYLALNPHTELQPGRGIASAVSRSEGQIAFSLAFGGAADGWEVPDTLQICEVRFLVLALPVQAPVVTLETIDDNPPGEGVSLAGPRHPPGEPDGTGAVRELRQNLPNPFNPVTTIAFSLDDAQRVSLGVYDVRGRLVRALLTREEQAAGSHAVSWDGLDARGSRVPAGVYFYRVSAGSWSDTKRMVVAP